MRQEWAVIYEARTTEKGHMGAYWTQHSSKQYGRKDECALIALAAVKDVGQPTLQNISKMSYIYFGANK